MDPNALPESCKNPPTIVQNRCQNGPKSRSGGGLGGSWSTSGCLRASWERLGASWARLESSWGRLGMRLGGALGRLGDALGKFEASLRAT